MIKRMFSLIAFSLGCILVAISCTSLGESFNEIPTSVESQLASGSPIYTQTCATRACHGTQGEGIHSANGFSTWPLVGKDFQSRHPNAQIVFDVIRSGCERNLLALTDQQIYDAIAYQLSQNHITLKAPLTADNAYATFGGKMSGKAQSGLFPPADDATLIDTPLARDLPIAAQNDRLKLQMDQIAQAAAIGNDKGIFLILVIAFSDLTNETITISPDHLKLSTSSGELLEPQSINIQSAIEKFHRRTIKPQHGTVSLVVFTLSTPEGFDQLIYEDGVGEPITLALKP
jgi:hypothetical protein